MSDSVRRTRNILNAIITNLAEAERDFGTMNNTVAIRRNYLLRL